MHYTIKPIPTWYDGVWHRSRLEGFYACFLYHQVGWSGEYEPEFDQPLQDWGPDFSLLGKIPWHGGLLSLRFLAEIKPVKSIAAFAEAHPIAYEQAICWLSSGVALHCEAVMLLGETPEVSYFQWDGREYDLPYLMGDCITPWNRAVNTVMSLQPDRKTAEYMANAYWRERRKATRVPIEVVRDRQVRYCPAPALAAFLKATEARWRQMSFAFMKGKK